MDQGRRIPPFAEDALDVLREAVEDRDDDLLKDEAETLLADDERLTETDAEYALNLLQNRGHIYYVDDHVRITPTDD